MPKLNADDLNRLYTEANEVDKEIFSEMRSNILLISGDHYNRSGSKYWNRIRKAKDIDEDQKLRLTKNHIKRICNEIETTILAAAPGTQVVPFNQDEIQDQKSAELNNSVLNYYKKTLQIRERIRELSSDLVSFGESWIKLIYDKNFGKVKGYEPLVDPMTMQPFMDQQTGQPVPDESRPIMEGSPVLHKPYPFNILRAPEAQNFNESPYIIERKMIQKEELKALVGEEMYSKVSTGSESTYMVFKGDSASYHQTKNEILVREHYYRPSKEYPKGYYFIATAEHILTEGELPGGIWPWDYVLYDKIPTSCRGRSPVKQMRPYQIEINRSASAIATAQITLGDDKLIMTHGSKIAHGGQVPGVRAISVTGSGGGDVQIMQGRSGEQYVPYMQSQITELYQVMSMEDLDVVNSEGNLDPYAMLFRSMKNKRRFSKYTEGFEEFCIRFSEKLLEICKFYMEEDQIIPIVGRCEQVNIAEFKNSDPNKYKIKVEAIGPDAETMLGKQIAINQTLQYVGQQLEKEELGKLLRAMPMLNQEESFDEFTIDYDNVKNDMLALERGEMPPVHKDDNHAYIIKRLVHRMKKPDFQFLDPNVQNNFNLKKQAHQLIEAKKQAEILRLQQGLIPTGGYLVTCDFYTTTTDGKTNRVRLPYEAVRWLIEQLKAQGNSLEELEKMQGAQGDVSKMTADKLGMPPSSNNGGVNGARQSA